MKSINQLIKEKPAYGWLLFFFTMAVVFLLGLLASSIVERRAEGVFAYTPQVEHGQYEPKSSIWGENFPRQYQSWLQTADSSFKSKYNGSAHIDMLEEDPRMVVLWAGYGFAKDYTQARGHYYAVNDITNSLRTGAPIGDQKSPMPNTCWTCKSPDVPRLMAETSPAEFYMGSWETKGDEINNQIGCADCHNAENMNLVITRPALLEALQNTGRDIDKVSHQEMRTLVCAQCHVEYYFDKNIVEGVDYLKFPWDKGLTVDDAEAYYDSIGFSDWTHTISKAPMLKAQHPGYEIYLTGTHASRGVSCADCHMPYISEGGQKFTSHHIQSPLNNINPSCQVCHREETERLIEDVYSRQDKIHENRIILEDQLVRAHLEAQKSWEMGATESQMTNILQLIRAAQWRWDYAVAGHGSSFHSSLEVLRMITAGLEKAQQARLEMARLLAGFGYMEELPYPDISTKAKAQAFIGLDMEALNAEKEIFLENVDWK